MEMIETGPHDGAGHVDDELAGQRSATEASMVTCAGVGRIGIGARRRD
jgi:hypothetical protein